MSSPTMNTENGPRVVIIGAGVGGLAMAIALKKKLNFENFTIVEKASSIGGTWRDNDYPGCACDIPVHWYSLSTEINPDWPEQFASQRDILQYWKRIYEKYNLEQYTRFNTRVIESTWDDKRQSWLVNTEKQTENGLVERTILEANVVVSAVGLFVLPFYAGIEGRERFKGIQMHSSRWNHSVNLSGKKVGVIGIGCSAAQIVPEISKDPSVQVVNICRTPTWFSPRGQSSYSAALRTIFRNIPGAAKFYRNFIAVSLGIQVTLLYMRFTAPKKYHKELTPNYPMGCKRVVLDPGYYASLHRPNVELAWGGVKEVLEDGVITGKGEKFELDIIVYGTGFQVLDPALNFYGREGKDLMGYFASKGGPEAYISTTYPGFPNLFTLLGPNTVTGHTSTLYGEEIQINYIFQLIKPILEGSVKSYEIKAEVADRYNVDLQKRISQMTWTECHNHYQAGENGKNTVTFPGSAFRFWRLLRKADYHNYICIVGNDGVESRKNRILEWDV
ncbi:hypothetical protein Clacol_006959 [Clathrus columnatus]|uniref:Flavin-containing monooxygenase n=1 Tax=Clathrus columnatus TaxID=1419009 RepID=A0AAV5ALC9_9AGAM|nr:hypothetical protein Clacol_006959 [Clathrus columnatus]